MKADKKKMEQLIKTVKGQMDGILKMMDEDRYCIDISNQILSAQAILSKVNREVLKAHLGLYRTLFACSIFLQANYMRLGNLDNLL